jgi:hypothetical protein
MNAVVAGFSQRKGSINKKLMATGTPINIADHFKSLRDSFFLRVFD